VRSDVDHDLLNDALRRCGASWTAAQTHGLLSSRLAVAGTRGVAESLGQVLEGSNEPSAVRKECEDMLSALWQSTHLAFSERLSAFEPLLPDDNDAVNVRTEALAHWCEGYLHGLVSGEHDAALKERLAAEPLADIIKDMLQITRATTATTKRTSKSSNTCELRRNCFMKNSRNCGPCNSNEQAGICQA